jgi:hypothetical protein
MIQKRFYILSPKHGPEGLDAIWLCPNGCGYTIELEKAGIFTQEEAEAIISGCQGEHRGIEQLEVIKASYSAVNFAKTMKMESLKRGEK